MTFTLTDSLLNEIQSALENQEKQFLVDAAQNKLVEKTEGLKGDDDLFYNLFLAILDIDAFGEFVHISSCILTAQGKYAIGSIQRG